MRALLAPDLRRALGYVRPYWRPLALVLTLSLIGTALSLILPYFFRAFVDRVLIGRDAGVLVRIVLAFFGITLASFALNVVSGLKYTKVSADILFDMRLALFRHLQALSPRFYARMPLGQIMSRINSDLGEVQRVVTEAALAWMTNVLFLAGTVLILLYLDPVLFAASLAVLPVAAWALVRYRNKLEASIASLRNESAAMGTFLLDSMQAMRLVVSLNAQEREAVRFRAHNDSFVSSLLAMRKLTYLAGGLPGLLLTVGSAAVFLLGGWRVIQGTITAGTLIAFVAYQVRLLGPLQGLMGLYAGLATARVSLKRVHEILDAPIEVVDTAAPVAIGQPRGDVVFRNVTLAHGRGTVLDRVSLHVQSGERVALVGPSGVGKSTIADLLARHVDPDNGAVLFDGHDLRTLRLSDVRRHVVVVDQDPFVFNTTIETNLRFARPDATDGDLAEAVRASGLADLVGRCPDGLRTVVGERGRALSAGERQRLAIARAFLADPTVLVLDEATGALDPATEAEVLAGYDAAMRGRTTVMITHRLALARRATRVLVLEGGRVVEEGTPDVLLGRGGTFARVFASGGSDAAS